MPNFDSVSDLKRILVIRLSSIGDIVVCTSVVRCLKLQLGIELHFAVKQRFADVLRDNIYIDKLHVMADQSTLHQSLKQYDFDLIVDLHRNLRSWRIQRALGVKRITYNKLRWKKWWWVNTGNNHMPPVHLVDRYFDSLEPLGVVNDGAGHDFFVSDQDRHGFRQKRKEYDPSPTQKYVALVLGAAHYTKRFPLEKCQELLGVSQEKFLLVGGPAEKELGEQLADSFPHVVSFAGRLSLHESAALIEDAQVVVTGDTGMMHISAALRKRIVMLWGSTHRDLGMYPYYGAEVVKHHHSRVDLGCNPCTKIGNASCPKGHFKCMMDQDVFEIKRQLQELVA